MNETYVIFLLIMRAEYVLMYEINVNCFKSIPVYFIHLFCIYLFIFFYLKCLHLEASQGQRDNFFKAFF